MRSPTVTLALVLSAVLAGCGTTRPTGTVGVNEFARASHLASSSPIRSCPECLPAGVSARDVRRWQIERRAESRYERSVRIHEAIQSRPSGQFMNRR